MFGCLQTHVRKQPIIAPYFEFENELKFYNLGTIALTKHAVSKDHIEVLPIKKFIQLFSLLDLFVCLI